MSNIIPFGKYKGQPVEILQQDKKYCDWLLTQQWFREKHAQFNTIIINNFQEPTETPEHNKMQAQFLENEFCKAVIEGINPEINFTEINIEGVAFEYHGIDILLTFTAKHTKTGDKLHRRYYGIEIKPTVSDDYPATLRQIRGYMRTVPGMIHYILYAGEYTGIGATKEQLCKIFEKDGIPILFDDKIKKPI